MIFQKESNIGNWLIIDELIFKLKLIVFVDQSKIESKSILLKREWSQSKSNNYNEQIEETQLDWNAIPDEMRLLKPIEVDLILQSLITPAINKQNKDFDKLEVISVYNKSKWDPKYDQINSVLAF